MKCPNCGGGTTCVDSRETPKRRFRKRKCKDCGLIFATEERRSKEAWDVLNKCHRVYQRARCKNNAESKDI